MRAKILCVDDDPHILSAFQRQLRREFDLEVAESGALGLARLTERGPFAVVVSDLSMPGMDGIAFLSRVKAAAPDTVRVMLTGQADLSTAIEAVNQGAIFRFLTKPCATQTLAGALAAGVEQYRLVRAERELLEKTLAGSVKLLTDTLSLVSPAAFGRAVRVQRLMRRLAERLGVSARWEFELAALLSQVGCVSLPAEVVDNLHDGRPLSPDERRMFEAHPQIGRELIANIPRLEGVAEIIAYQEKRYDGQGPPRDDRAGQALPLGARALHVALDFDTLTSSGKSTGEALLSMQAPDQAGAYDPALLSALAAALELEVRYEPRSVTLDQLAGGMILADEVKSDRGQLLVAKGQEVTTTLRLRLRNFARTGRIREPLQVLVPVHAPAGTSEE